MKVHRLSNSLRVFLNVSEFSTLRNAAESDRARRVIELGAQSMRKGELVDAKRGDIFEEQGLYWIHIESKETTDKADLKPRDVWLPDPIYNRVESHMDRNGVEEDDEIFSVSGKTLHRDIKAAAKNAAVATGKPNFNRFSIHDLRRYYATHYLFRVGLDAQVVREMGGWRELEHMLPYLALPSDVVQAELLKADLLSGNPQTMTRPTPEDTIRRSIETARRVAELEDAEEEMKTSIIELAKSFNGIDVTRPIQDVSTTEETDSTQTSLDFDDDHSHNDHADLAF